MAGLDLDMPAALATAREMGATGWAAAELLLAMRMGLAAGSAARRTEGSVPKCSLSKYGFRASGVRTRASADRAETGLLPRFLRSVLKRPSQEVRRERASGEQFLGFSAQGQSTGLPRKPQETCHSARRLVRWRVRLVWELAEEVPPDMNGRWAP